MGNYNAEYENYYKSLSKNNYGGGSVYYTGYKSSPKNEHSTWFTKRLTQELIGVFVMLLFVVVCRSIVTPKTQQAYSYAKNVVNKSYDYKSLVEKAQGLTLESIQKSTTDWMKKLQEEIIDGTTIQDKLKLKGDFDSMLK